MIEKIANRKRLLDDIRNSDIIYKKARVKEILESDPDLAQALDYAPHLPLNQFKDKNNPTQAELKQRKRIENYNQKLSKPQIIPWIKLNGVQTEVKNYICYDIFDQRQNYDNKYYKNQMLQLMIFVHEDEMQTEYGVTRTDLIDYIIKDLLGGSNRLGLRMLLYSDTFQITDNQFYCRILQFNINAPNTNEFRAGSTKNTHEGW